MRKLAFLFCIVAFQGSICGQTFDRAKMSRLFAKIDKNDQGMGSLSIHVDGKELYQKVIGFADLKQEIKANARTRYRIGSITKTFTATLIMQLTDEQKLSLQSTLAEFYPELPNAEKITMEQLLRHQSGLFNFTSGEDYPDWMEAPKSQRELLDLFVKNGTVFLPGEKTGYSNTNYVLLGFIAEKITGKPYAQLLEERITGPLRLKNTVFGQPITATNNEAVSYQRGGRWKPATETDLSISGGAGAIASTPGDLNEFFHGLFTGKLVSDEALKQMTTIQSGYGLGLMVLPFMEKKSYGHFGAIDGFRAAAGYFPEENLAISYLSNAEAMLINSIMIGVLSIYFDRSYELPEFTPAIRVKSKQLEQYPGVYSAPDFPMKLTVWKEGNQLMAQGTGQSAIPLEAYAEHKFRYEPALLKIDFLPDESKLILMQSGYEFELTRE